MSGKKERLGDLIIQGLKEGIAHERGELKLRVTEVMVPPPPPSYAPEDVVRIRESLNMSQAAFALLLAVSKDAVQNWEQGRRAPRGGTSRLLQIIEHPELVAELRRA